MKCIRCNSEHVQKDGNYKGLQRYRCMECKKRFNGEPYANHYITHFNVKIKKNNNNYITRENFCIPTKEIDYKHKKNIQFATNFYKVTKQQHPMIPSYYFNIPNSIFEDEEHYTDEYVNSHYEKCMKNYDLNMKYFANINHDEFNNYLVKFTKKHKLVEIDNLNRLNNVSGIYMLVLDKYNQVYIGQTSNIKKRIMAHWSRKKEFGRLLHGNENTSIISIDSFGALDTTRIFYKYVRGFYQINEVEKEITDNFEPKFKLNRIGGGLNAEESGIIRNLNIMSTTVKRNLN